MIKKFTVISLFLLAISIQIACAQDEKNGTEPRIILMKKSIGGLRFAQPFLDTSYVAISEDGKVFKMTSKGREENAREMSEDVKSEFKKLIEEINCSLNHPYSIIKREQRWPMVVDLPTYVTYFIKYDGKEDKVGQRIEVSQKYNGVIIEEIDIPQFEQIFQIFNDEIKKSQELK